MPTRRRRKLAAVVSERIDALAALSCEAGRLSRPYLSNEHLAAAQLVQRWMQDAGLSASINATGTVAGRHEAERENARTLVLGSHIDTVSQAGRFSGPLGVLVAIEAVGELRRTGRRLPFAIDIMAFGDDIGGRFTNVPVGSRALAGPLGTAMLDATDSTGTALRQALQDFGCVPDQIGRLVRKNSSLLGFLEVYCEQGPVLESEGVPIGVVTSISGIERLKVMVSGADGHACTMPFGKRRDALAAAAEMVLATEILCRQTAGLAATVGTIGVEPGRPDAIPASAWFEVELRSHVDRTRRMGQRSLERSLKGIARRRSCELRVETVLEVPAVECDARFVAQLSRAVERSGIQTFMMPSGVGNGGTSLARLCPVGMLVVRCKNGVSCHPSEHVKADDIEVAIKVLLDFLVNLDMIGAR